MNDPQMPAYAHTVRLVSLPPQDPKSAPVNPQPLNAWLIIPRHSLTQTLEPLCAQRHLPKGKFLAALEATLVKAGTPIPYEVPFIALRMAATQDGRPHALGLSESLDWTVTETVAEAMHTAALDEVPDYVIQHACHWSLPTLIETLKLSARVMMEDAAREATIEAGLSPRPTAEETLAALRQVYACLGLAPLPPDEYQLLLDLLKAATPVARKQGLNPHQLFCEGRLHRLIPGDQALFAFEHLPPARQDAARLWVAAVLGWGKLYIPPAPLPLGDGATPDDVRTSTEKKGGNHGSPKQ